MCSETRTTNKGKRIEGKNSVTITKAEILNRRIVNLSSLKLTQLETNLLQRGLNFCPTPPPPKLETLNKDIDAFARRLNLRDYLAPDNTDDIEQQPMYRSSILDKLNQRERREHHYTPSREPYLNSYVDRSRQDIAIEISNTHRFQRGKLNKRERVALKRLSNNRDKIIKPADKGGATVIVNTKDFITEAMRQLSNEE